MKLADPVHRQRVEKWVEALESGEYLQGHGELRHLNEFCCLGVACDVAIKDGLDLRVTRSGGSYIYNNSSGYLPEAVVEYYGLQCNDPYFSSGGSAISVNDGGTPFTEIARLIRETYL